METNESTIQQVHVKADNQIIPPPILITQGTDGMIWINRIMARNPFYPISALLLLYSISLLSKDPNFLSSETRKLYFNFGSLQFYEWMVVVTSIFLARRWIEYDSVLLAGLENLLLFVPLILISQAVFLEDAPAWILCGVGIACVAGRFCAFKSWMPQLNLPRPLMAIGVTLLVVQAAFPALFRALYMDADPIHRSTYVEATLNAAWHVFLPAVVFLGILLPAKSDPKAGLAGQSWLPALFLALWVVAVGMHLVALGYVYSCNWQLTLIIPALWAALWVVHFRLSDYVDIIPAGLGKALFGAPAFLTLFLINPATLPVFTVLSLFNGILYGINWLRDEQTQRAAWLSRASLAGALVGIIGPSILPIESDHYFWAFLIVMAVVYGWLTSITSKDPRMGIAGALITLPAIFLYSPHSTTFIHLAMQSSLLFLLLHSLRWEDTRHVGATTARLLASTLWTIQSIYWMQQGKLSLALAMTSAGFMLALIIVRSWCLGFRMPLPILVSSLMVLAGMPIHWLYQHAMTYNFGLLVLLSSFLLFGAGTFLALNRKNDIAPSSQIPLRKHNS